ncbi:MAG: hypothetical protein NPIRA02_20180 [Nitrospirales bacterium]|nr:MAG: hypothetical protein NPIRA02_20180 [Nitrospirales bacterium]
MLTSMTFLKMLLLSLAIVFQLYDATSLYAEPYIPQDDSVVLEQLPVSRDPQIKKLRRLRTQLSKHPEDLTLAVQLARAYLHLGQTKADPRYDGYAKSALASWWNMTQPPPEVLILRATLRQRQHDFDRALQDLSLVINDQSNHAQAWLTRAVIYQVRGNYQDARQSCLPLLRLTNTLISTACLANAMSMNGHALESYHSLQRSIEQDSSSTPQEKLWALTILAETATRLGKYPEAEQYFQEALTIEREDTYLLGAYSDFLLDQGRPKDVHVLLKNQTLPDGLLLRLTLAEHQLNSSTRDKHVETLKARFAENRLRGEARHLREEARFTLHLLHQPKHALKLALENWNIQREPWDARMVLETSLLSGDRSAAQPVLNWLSSNNLEDTQLQKLIGPLS